MTLFERIQELAKKRDKTLKDISLELGYSKNYLYTLQKQSPKAENLQVIADYFKVSTDYLLGRTDNPDPDNTKLDTSDLEDVLDNMKSFGGVEMTDRDKETIRAFLKGKFSDR